MPMVGFGTWQLGGSAYEAVRYALEVGYRHLDTATMYRNEHEVGQALRDSGLDRGEVFVTTKLQPGNAARARATLAESLRALGTDHVDLWLIHWPPRRSASVPLWREFLDPGLLAAHADRHQVTPAQVVLRWHLEHGITVIPESAHPDRIKSNFDLFSFSLTPEEVARVDRL